MCCEFCLYLCVSVCMEEDYGPRFVLILLWSQKESVMDQEERRRNRVGGTTDLLGWRGSRVPTCPLLTWSPVPTCPPADVEPLLTWSPADVEPLRTLRDGTRLFFFLLFLLLLLFFLFFFFLFFFLLFFFFLLLFSSQVCPRHLLRSHVFVCLVVYIHTWYIYIYIHTYVFVCPVVYIHTYMIHIYIHTYVYMCVCVCVSFLCLHWWWCSCFVI